MDLVSKNISLPSIYAVLLLAAFIMFYNLHKIGLFETSEGRYAEISREMVESSDLITPTLNGIKHFHKPPFTYWITALGLKIFGVNEFGGRFFLVIASLLGIYFCYRTARCLWDEAHGIYAALILLSSFLYLIISRSLTTDIFLTASCIMAFYFFSSSYFLKKNNIALFWVITAVSFLIKGPVGIMIIFLPMIAYSFLDKDSHIIKTLCLKKGIPIFLLISLPWFILVIVKNPGLLSYFIDYHIVKRVASDVHQRSGPFYYFIVVFFAGMFPWSFFIPELFVTCFKKFKKDNNDENKKLLMICIFFIIPFIVFSISRSKLPAYILPLFPFAAIAVSYAYNRFYYFNEFYRSIYAFVFFNFFLSCAVTYFVFFVSDPKLESITNILILLCVLFWFYSISTYFTFQSYNKKFVSINIIFFITLCFFIITYAMPKIEHHFNCLKKISNTIIALKNKNDRIINYKCFINSIPFYVQEKIILADVKREIQFDETEDYEHILFEKGLGNLIKKITKQQNFHYFVVCKKDDWKKIEQIHKFPVLEKYDKHVLFWTGNSKESALEKLLY